jgi:hypothetical protein
VRSRAFVERVDDVLRAAGVDAVHPYVLAEVVSD